MCNQSVPIRDGMLLSEGRAAIAWRAAYEQALQNFYRKGSAAANMRAFNNELVARIIRHGGNLGSNNAQGTAINHARNLFDRARPIFGRMVSLPPNTQLHHVFDHVAGNPFEVFNPSNVQITSGQASVSGTTHNLAHVVDVARQRGYRNPGRTAMRYQRLRASRQGFAQLGTLMAIISAAALASAVVHARNRDEAIRLLSIAGVEFAAGATLARILGGFRGGVVTALLNIPGDMSESQMLAVAWQRHVSEVADVIKSRLDDITLLLSEYDDFVSQIGSDAIWNGNTFEDRLSYLNINLEATITTLKTALGTVSREDLPSLRRMLIHRGAAINQVHRFIR